MGFLAKIKAVFATPPEVSRNLATVGAFRTSVDAFEAAAAEVETYSGLAFE